MSNLIPFTLIHRCLILIQEIWELREALGRERKYALAQRLACKTFWMLVDVSSYTFDLWLCFQGVIEIDLCECVRVL